MLDESHLHFLIKFYLSLVKFTIVLVKYFTDHLFFTNHHMVLVKLLVNTCFPFKMGNINKKKSGDVLSPLSQP